MKVLYGKILIICQFKSKRQKIFAWLCIFINIKGIRRDRESGMTGGSGKTGF